MALRVAVIISLGAGLTHGAMRLARNGRLAGGGPDKRRHDARLSDRAVAFPR